MADRRKLLVHSRRLSSLLDKAFREGPDGTLEGKFASEHPVFVHYSNAIFLCGSLAFLEGEDGSYSWNGNSPAFTGGDFDAFCLSHPVPQAGVPPNFFSSKGVSRQALDALACIRNAVAHHDGDLSLNRDSASVSKVTAAALPGVVLTGSIVELTADFLEFVRIATYAVRSYYGET